MIRHFILPSLGNSNPFKDSTKNRERLSEKNLAFPALSRGPGI